jgi:hypothetical protein
MNDNQFKQQVIKALGIEQQSKEEQDTLLAKVELLADTRFATALPELLNDDQYTQIEQMQAEGKKTEEILSWVESQIPSYKEIMQAMILDIAEELTDGLDK